MNELQGVDRFISFVSAWHEDICVQWLKLRLVSKWSETGESKKILEQPSLSFCFASLLAGKSTFQLS